MIDSFKFIIILLQMTVKLDSRKIFFSLIIAHKKEE